jgi:hypothetical protein
VRVAKVILEPIPQQTCFSMIATEARRKDAKLSPRVVLSYYSKCVLCILSLYLVNVAAIYHDEKANQWDVWEKGLPAALAGVKIPVLLGLPPHKNQGEIEQVYQ